MEVSSQGRRGSLVSQIKGAPTEAAPVSLSRGFFLSDAEGDDQMEPGRGQSCDRQAEADVEHRREPPRVGFIWVLLDRHTK